MARMVRKQINIEERQDEILKREARMSGRSESELIRKAIDDVYAPEVAAERRRVAIEAWERSTEKVHQRMRELGPAAGPVWEGREAIYRNSRGTIKKHDA